jgi:hypothetical protein
MVFVLKVEEYFFQGGNSGSNKVRAYGIQS